MLVVDNFDSLVYNLVQYLGELGAHVEVRRNDEVTVGEIEAMAPELADRIEYYDPEVENLPISAHFRISDFLTRDGQTTWPRYVALDTRILDKVELVLRYLGSREHDMPVSLHSGFRTPYHNRRVPRAASDSRHQYGDAADLAIDVDEDGRITYLDVLAVSRAVEMVERDYPALVGGLGLYGNLGTAAYVHIDVRGTRKRWRG